jgi:DNA-binding CsgD family transcriptional regulator
MVGRSGELHDVVRAWRQQARLVVIAGPPGIGRTTLALEVAGALRAAGADTLVVRATAQATSMPLAALLGVVTAHDTDGSGDTGDALHGTGGALHDTGENGDTRDPRGAGGPAVDLVSSSLRRRSTSGRLVVVVDDAHLLDHASATVLCDLVEAGSGAALVVATAPDHRLVGPLLGHPTAQRVDLGPLPPEGVVELLTLHGTEVADVDGWLERSGGNPTALLRLADAARDRGAAPTDLPVDVLDTALDALSARARDLLDVIAVAAPLDERAVAALAATGDGGRDVVTELLGSRLVERVDHAGGTELRFVHEADRTVVLGRLRPLRLRSVVRRAIDATRATGAPRTAIGLVRLTDHALAVGSPVPTEELVEAARAAYAGTDSAAALRLARAAADATGALEDLRRYVDLAYESGDTDGVAEGIARIGARLAEDPEDLDARVALGLAIAERSFWRGGDTATALDALVEAAVGPRRHEVDAVRARILAAVGRSAEAVELARPIAGGTDPRARAQAAAALGHALRRRGRPAQAVVEIDAVLALPAADDPVLLVSAQVLGSVRALALLEAGRWADADDEALRARARAERYDDVPGLAVATLVHARVSAERGRIDDARRRARRALEALERLRQPAGVCWSRSVLAFAAALAGDVAAARTELDHLDHGSTHPATLLTGVDTRARAGAVAAAHPDLARRLLLDGAAELAAAGDRGAAAWCLLELVPLDAVDEALAAFDRLGLPDEPGWLRAHSVLAATARGDVERLGLLAEEHAAIGGDRWAAECAAAAAGAAARQGDRRAARHWADRTGALLDRCPGLATMSLVTARVVGAGAQPLTSRERDVAVLAAHGVTSAEIAQRLGISVRTVENHLANCYDKLGVRTRAALGPILGLDDPPRATLAP